MDTGFPIVVWCLCFGLGSAVTLPFLAGVQGACAWARVSALPRHFWLGFVVRALGFGFGGNPATPRWGIGCVCLVTGFGRASPFLAGVGGVCVWVRVFPALCFFWFGKWGVWPLACAPSVSRHPLVGLPVAWGCAGVAVGGICPPPAPFFFFFGLPEGGVVLGPVVSWLCGARRCLSRSWASWSSSPLPLLFGLHLCFFFSVARHLSGGVCAGVSGVSFPPMGRCSRLSVVGFGWVALRCSFLLAYLVGLGSGSAGWGVAPGGFVRPWVKGGGVFRVPPPLWRRL